MQSLNTSRSSTFEKVDGSSTRQKTVLIVMPETKMFAGEDFVGNTILSLAASLTKAQQKVAFLVIDHGALSKEEVTKFSRQCADESITLRYIVRDKYVHFAGQKCACDSYLVYQWLSENETFDIVHFPDLTGLGYYSQLAKRQGLAFETTHFVVDVFGPTLWRKALSQEFVTSTESLALDFIERESVKMADSLFSPLPLYLDVLKSEGWSLPDSQYKLQLNILTRGNATQSKNPDASVDSPVKIVDELVYLGVMEERDGLSTFCDALDKLVEKIPRTHRITFLGSSSATAGRNAEAYIATRAQKWPWSWQFIHADRQQESIEYLKTGTRLAILGSTTTTSLLLAFQCAINSIPFMCNEQCTGNIASDFSALKPSFFLGEADLSARLGQELVSTQINSAPQISTDHKRWWIDAHQNIFRSEAVEKTPAEKTSADINQPLVSVCMAHYNRPHYLRMALDSLKSQDYKNIQVIVADDGSTASGVQQELDILEKEIADRNWKILRLPHRNVGATRSAAAAAATGDFILFMDDDNFAHPHEISTMIKIVHNTSADIVTCFFDAFEGDVLPAAGQRPLYRKIFLGPAPDCGLTENVYGDANALIRRSLYFELGGFEDAPGIAWHDWTFFARAVLKGANLQVAPVPLLWYRVAANSMNRTSSEWRSAQSIIREYEEAMPPGLRHFPALLYGLIKDPGLIEQLARGNAEYESEEELRRPELLTENRLAAASQVSTKQQPVASPGAIYAARGAALTASNNNSIGEISGGGSSGTSGTKSNENKDVVGLSEANNNNNNNNNNASLKSRLASNKFLLYSWWFLTWQWPLRMHERQTAAKLFEARIKQLGMTDLFDARWYRSKYGAAIADPITHYLTTGAASGFEPGPNFNSRWYLERSENASSSEDTLLEHYLEHGTPAGIEPSPDAHPDFADFDQDYYIQNNPDLTSIQISPFAHFVLYGKAEGRAPNAKLATYANFDPTWYLARYPEVAEENISPLEHYRTRGQFEGKVPRAEDDPEGIGFDEYWYCQRYPDLAECTVPPLLHYLIYGRQEGRLKRALDGPNSVAKTLSERFPDQQPLRVFAVPKLPKRITLILDSVNNGLYGRNGTAIIFAALWSEHLKTPLRIVTRNELARAASVNSLLTRNGITLSQAIEFNAYNDHESNSQLSTGANEVFVTSGFRNTSSVVKVIPPEQIVYILQEDERLLYNSRDEYLRCSELLSNSKIRYVVNSQLLLDNLLQEGFTSLKTNASSFEPAFPADLFYQEQPADSTEKARSGETALKKNFFFYARPGNPQNLYYRGLEVISQALEQQILLHTEWTFHFVGSELALVKLPGNVAPQFSQNLDLQEYAKLLRSMDLGLALNLTPHPGYPTLELAASGAAVVTNTYQNKKSLDQYSANILCAEPSVEELVGAIKEGIKLASNSEKREQNYANNKIGRSWQQSFETIFKNLPGV
jgi:glycosyltransferase involved in cell wall biosynthesis